MATDFGDESGEKLFDWMLRMGQDAGQDAIRDGANRFKSAIQHLRGQIDKGAERPSVDAPQYAKLNLAEFEEIPYYDSIKELINDRFADAAIDHEITKIGGHDHLVFNIADTIEVDELFENLADEIDGTVNRVCKRMKELQSAERDEEPLEEKAEAAKEASKALSESRDVTRMIERTEGMSR